MTAQFRGRFGLLFLDAADVDRIVEHVDRAPGKSRDGYRQR
jgi:hypothetical protein